MNISLRTKLTAFCLLATLAVPWRGAFAGDVGITYVKTIGQVWPALPLLSGGGRLSVDEQGNLYAGSPGQNSFLHKLAPNGRVLWRADDTHCAYYGTAVDDKYVYGSGIGYYGYGHLLRRKKASGVVPPGWNFVWPKPTDVVQGVRGFVSPGPLLVDDTYLYVLDLGTGELRRLDKETGEEKPFATPTKIDGAIDMAFSQAGSILMLVNPKSATPPAPDAALPATTFVAELDKGTDEIKRLSFITGLRRSAAIAVHPRSGAIYVGEGGSPERPINKVRVYAADGTAANETLGRGGEWQGPWSADALAFSTGQADIAFDPAGGWWTNGFTHRSGSLSWLVHRNPNSVPDAIVLGATGDGIAVGPALNAAIGGNYMLSWDGYLQWTSGLVMTGKPNQFPTTLAGWTLRPAYVDAERAVFVNIHGPAAFAVNAQTGEGIGAALALPVPGVAGITSVGQNIYILGGGKVLRTTAALTTVQEVFTLPEALAKKPVTGVAVSEDEKTFCISAGYGAEARLYAYRDGAPLWEAKAGTVLTRYKGMLVASSPESPGILALDMADGSLSGIFGHAAIDDRPALAGMTGAAIGSKDGADYLFVACAARVLVYRIVAAS